MGHTRQWGLHTTVMAPQQARQSFSQSDHTHLLVRKRVSDAMQADAKALGDDTYWQVG